jgi:hypothetical protein
MSEKPDSHIYSWVTIFADSMRFFVAATRHYQEKLEEELARIKSDDLFSGLLTTQEVDSLEIAKEAKRFREMGDRLQAKIDAAKDAWDYDLTIRHQDVRVLKALGSLYLHHLRSRRDSLVSSHSFSILATQALDAKLARYEELLASGVFRDASLWPLLLLTPREVPPPSQPAEPPSPPQFQTPPARGLSSIEILVS